ncbi:MAG: glycosyltransferase family 39 protein [Chloroflexota bacterium]
MSKRWLWLILGSYGVLGLLYALVTPPLEASDEYKHYPVVQFVQTQGALPILDPTRPGLWRQEAAQPPLYYVLMAALTAGIDTSDLADVHRLNPHAFIGDPNQVSNKNLIIHQPTREHFPWRGSVLALMLIRFASVGLGLGTIILVARLGTTLFGSAVGWLAAAWTAFNPMFLFVHAAVNNDALAILFGHLGFYLLVRLWQDVPDPRHEWRRYVVLGAVLGLAILTKLSLAALLGLTGLALASLAWRRHAWRLFWLGGPIVLLTTLFVSGGWFIRNGSLYQDLTGLNVFIAVQGVRDHPLTWSDWLGEFGTFYRSFWGLFGGVNVAAPEPFYFMGNLLAVIGTIGWLGWLWSRRAAGTRLPLAAWPVPEGHWLLVAWPLLLFILLLRWTTIAPSFQGRLIFPALGAINTVWAAGWLAWVSPRWRPRLALGWGGGTLVAATLIPWLVIRPAYTYPTPLAELPPTAQFGPITFQANEDLVQLVGVEVPPDQSVTPVGEPVEVVLYWRADEPVQQDYLSTVHLLGQQNTSVGQINRYPAGGMIPTSQWQPGQIWRDVYHVVVIEDAVVPARLRVLVGLYDTQVGQALAASGPDGAPMELVIVGEARLTAKDKQSAQPPVKLAVALADGLALQGYRLEPQPAAPSDQLQLTLYWQATAAPSLDYTVFVHLLDAAGTPVVVADGPPVAGDYPTSFWQAGEQIEDRHTIPLPPDLEPGIYRLAVGFYDPVSGRRVQRLDGAGDVIEWQVEVSH